MDNTFSTYFGSGSQDGCVLVPQYAGDLRAEVITDSIIPDTVADVEKILLTIATPKIDGHYLGESTLEIEGSVTYQVLLLVEGGELANLTITEPFTLKQDVSVPAPDCRVVLLPTLDYVSARLLNPRKLNLRSQTTVSTRLFCCLSTTPTISGTESLDDDMNIQRSYQTVNTADVTTVEEKAIPVSQDIELDSSAPAAADILMARITLCPSDVRLRGDEADVKTEACLSLLYRSEEGNCFATEKKFTLEKSLSLPPIEGAEWFATATPGTVSAQIAANAYGEMKIIELDFPYDLTVNAVGGKQVEAVADMYSTEFECDTTYRTLPVVKLHRMYTTNLTVNASAERKALGGETVRGILDGFVTLQDRSVTYQEDKRKLIVEGTANIALLGENNAVEGSEPLYSPMSFSYPFRCELDVGAASPNYDYVTEIRPVSTKFRADSNHLYADLELIVRVMTLETTPFPCLASLHLDHAAPVKHNTAPITLCYPSGRETLWDIAKYYRITEDSILLSNGMSGNDISGHKVLLIPRVQPKKAVFSKVI